MNAGLMYAQVKVLHSEILLLKVVSTLWYVDLLNLQMQLRLQKNIYTQISLR